VGFKTGGVGRKGWKRAAADHQPVPRDALVVVEPSGVGREGTKHTNES
jgi:hypothetical protein